MANEVFFPEIRLEEITLDNFRGQSHITIQFDEKLTVIIGNNGSGKTTILDGIAGFLHYFVYQTILDSADFQPLYKVKDIKNPKNEPASGAISLNTTFEFIEKNTLAEILNVIELLNKQEIEGRKAKIHFDDLDDTWQVTFDDIGDKPMITEAKIKIKQSEFQIAEYKNDKWVLSLDQDILKSADKNLWNDSDYQNKELKIDFEFNPLKKPEFITNRKGKDFIKDMETIAFLEDIKTSLENQLDTKTAPTPLFAYYGGTSMNVEVKYDTHFSLEPRNAYNDTLIPSRFSLSTFFNWFEEKQKIANEKLKTETQKIFNSEYLLSDKAKQLEGIMKNFTELVEEFVDIDNPREFPIIKEAQHIFLVKEAILQILNDDDATYSNIRVEYNNGFPEMLIHKKQSSGSNDLDINQLSSGERNLLALVGDMAIRLIQLNPKVANPLQEGRGIVLIDEIDLHLHPLWQRKVIPKLREIFPEIQFVVTTHSPLVFVYAPDGKVLNISENIIKEYKHFRGLHLSDVFYDYYGIKVRPDSIQEKIDKIFNLIDEEKVKEAQTLLNEIKKVVGNDDRAVIEAQTSINILL